mgnify:CR=1 FL=1
MKNKILFTICLLIFFTNSYSSRDTKNVVSEKKTVTIYYTPELQILAKTFVQEYPNADENTNFEIQQVSSKQISEKLQLENSLGFLSAMDKAPQSKDIWRMLIARQIIVPITNAENPNLLKLEEKGISPNELQETVIKKFKNLSIYTVEDNYAEHGLAQFLNIESSAMDHIKLSSEDELFQKLQKDKSAIGFCSILSLTGQDEFTSNFKILPIDKNENGHTDYHELVYRPISETEKNSGNLSAHENAYGSLDAFKRGVWIGKYPHSLVNEIYLSSANFPEKTEISEFIAWAITEGQQYIEGSDFNQLVYSERQSKLNVLLPKEIISGTAKPNRAASRLIIYFLSGLLAITLIIGIVVNRRQRKTKGLINVFHGQTKVLNEENLEIPNGVYFDKTHTWSFMEKDGSVKVGIDDFMQQVTGEYTNVKLKNPGDQILKNEPLITLVQDGKQIEIYAPISGKIKEINEDLITDPSEINKSPYTKGWLYSIEPSNWLREVSFMKMADSYKTWLKKEIERLKDFLAVSVNSENSAQVAFQEGGELTGNTIKEYGPRVWEDFQKKFIDTSDLN